MISVIRRLSRPRPVRARRSGASLAASLAVNAVLAALFVRALTVDVDWSGISHRGSAEVVPERIGFVQLPTPETRPAREGGDGRPATANPSAAPVPARSLPVAPTTVPSTLPPADPAGAAAPEGGSGPVVGRGGATEGIRPSYTDPRLWTTPGAVATAPRTAKERIDSVIADRLTYARDSMIAAREIAAGQRAPGDWTMKGPGGKWGMDQQNIHLGKVKIPNAVLALLSSNLQKNLRGNPTEYANERRLAEVRADLLRHADREMNEDYFRTAVKQIRERKDKERSARLLARRQAQEPATAEASVPPSGSSTGSPQR